jgi:hypothetical protein
MKKDTKKGNLPTFTGEKIKEPKNDTISAKFKLKSIIWKSGSTVWNIVLGIHGALSEAFIHYTAKFTFDEEPFKRRITTVEQEIERVKKDRQLFAEGQKQEIANLKDEISDITDEMEAMRKDCPDIEFQATAIKVDWTGDIPSVTFAVDSELVEELNKAKTKVDNYKIELTPLKK